MLCKALWALLSSICLPSSPTGLPGPPLLCSSHTSLLTIPLQARPTSGHLHILCSLPGMHLTWPWLTPSLPLGLCLSIIPSLATWCKIPTLPIPFPCSLFLWVMCRALISGNLFPLLKSKLQGAGERSCLFCSLLDPHCLSQGQAHGIQKRLAERMQKHTLVPAVPLNKRWSNTQKVQCNYICILGSPSLLSHLSLSCHSPRPLLFHIHFLAFFHSFPLFGT